MLLPATVRLPVTVTLPSTVVSGQVTRQVLLAVTLAFVRFSSPNRVRLAAMAAAVAHNIGQIAAAGADAFVAGSAIFNAPDYQAVIDQMRHELALVNA